MSFIREIKSKENKLEGCKGKNSLQPFLLKVKLSIYLQCEVSMIQYDYVKFVRKGTVCICKK